MNTRKEQAREAALLGVEAWADGETEYKALAHTGLAFLLDIAVSLRVLAHAWENNQPLANAIDEEFGS